MSILTGRWRHIASTFEAIPTEGRKPEDIFRDMEAAKAAIEKEHLAPGEISPALNHLFRKYSNPYNPRFHHTPPPRDDINDGSYTRICDIGTRI